MFTGIVADLGTLKSSTPSQGGMRMSFVTALDSSDFELGESIAVNGVCLTVDAIERGGFCADVSPETLAKSTLGALKPGDKVNLERALRPIDRLGGHFVLGHVDGVGRFSARGREGEFEVLSFTAPPEVVKYLVPKGSVSVEGISLTVASLKGDTFTVAVIPHTLQRTTLGGRQVGVKVNLEADILGKYVEKLLNKGERGGGLTMEALASGGFLR
ncbi:MAG: riboflavin synthase [Deltaproteobacteria bacterium]|nr:MAG: riboflavin synthase [Deltaproteobacteria bacterium]